MAKIHFDKSQMTLNIVSKELNDTLDFVDLNIYQSNALEEHAIFLHFLHPQNILSTFATS
jgi:hypothetical protein